MQSHIMLVPGFGGFDALGSLRYYHGVTEVLESKARAVTVHYFSNMPTASVLTRARALRKWLSELQERRALGPDDPIHLVGHSTGGLDLRQLLIDLREQERASGADGTPPIIQQIKTVQFLSTPHWGTALAHHLGGSSLQVFASRLFLRVLYEGAHGLRGMGLGGLGRGLKCLFHPRKTSDWLDAFIDTLVGCYSRTGVLEPAEARGTYSELLRWLLHMTSDFSAVTDLDPAPSSGARRSPAHASDRKVAEELAFIRKHDIRVRSIVTCASPDCRWTLFHLLHWLTAHALPGSLKRTRSIRKLWGDGEAHELRPGDNDGLVNSGSQVWPDEAHSCLLTGDHADVIGHFRSPPPGEPDRFRQYDLLNAPSGFDEQRFARLWEDIAAFTAVQSSMRTWRCSDWRERDARGRARRPQAFRDSRGAR
ncbi:esterase/lipase family protein [Pyxidicoccus sp. 3LG]